MMCMQRLVVFVAVVAAMALASPSNAFNLRLVAQLDTAALQAGVPGSVAAHGNTVYIGGLFGGGQLHRIVNPLTTPTKVNTFGGGSLPGNGYVTLSTDGVTLLAATDNADFPNSGVGDLAQSYAFGTDTLNWSQTSVPAQLNTQANTIDGGAVDPVTGRVMLTCFGCDTQNFYDQNSGASVEVPGANILFYPGVGTGWKDVDYDEATGDVYLRAWGGVARGTRVGDGQFQTLEGNTGIQTIVDSADDNFVSAINVAHLPAQFAGPGGAVIINLRGAPNTFFDQVKVFSATPPSADGTATDTPIAVTFTGADGVTPFNTAAAGSGIYDFSYDPINNLLYVSDFSTSQVHVFESSAAVGGVDGDYNDDGTVNAADYTVYRDNLGKAIVLPNDPTPGTVDTGDYATWVANYGVSGGAATAVPEPAALVLIAIGGLSFGFRRRP
ncbi:MAG: PEP-CTERM sorting domain-containing protein [Lacipirellulaceae bacterium]